MDASMEFTSYDTVLDLRKPKKRKYSPEPLNYSTPPPVQTYAPLTPPYHPVSIPYHTPLHVHHTPVMESRDDASDMSASPPGMVTSSYIMTNSVINAGRTGKPTRPFKAYPKDPLALSTAPSVILGHDSTEEYMEFRQKMLAQLEIVSCRNNSNMKRSISPQMPTSTAEMDDKTAAYWERRRKNNEAAKRSRDARRAKEDEIAIRAAFLEQENIKLKYALATVSNENMKLKSLIHER